MKYNNVYPWLKIVSSILYKINLKLSYAHREIKQLLRNSRLWVNIFFFLTAEIFENAILNVWISWNCMLVAEINRTETILTLKINFDIYSHLKNGKTNTRKEWNTELYWLSSYFEDKLWNENIDQKRKRILNDTHSKEEPTNSGGLVNQTSGQGSIYIRGCSLSS